MKTYFGRLGIAGYVNGEKSHSLDKTSFASGTSFLAKRSNGA